MKPENLLVTDNFELKLTDFGMAARTEGRDGSGQLKTQCGTRSYWSPEQHAGKKYDGQAVDIFSMGMLVFIFVAGIPPFSRAMPGDQLYNFFVKDDAETFWKHHCSWKPAGYYSEEFKELISFMFQYEPANRWKMSELAVCNWVTTGKIATDEEVHAEMQQRADNIKAEKEAQRLKEQKKREKQKLRRTKANRAVGDLNQELKEHNYEFAKRTCFECVEDDEDIWARLESYFNNNQLQWKRDDELPEMTYTTDVVSLLPAIGEENNAETIQVKIALSNNEAEDLRVVQFELLDGDYASYLRHVDAMKDILTADEE